MRVSAIEQILNDLKRLKYISHIHKDGKKIRLTSVTDVEGVEQFTSQGIVDGRQNGVSK